MTLGKNFRLPLDVKPRCYRADLRVDLGARAFTGRLAIDLDLAEARSTLTLHALDLAVAKAEVKAGAEATRAAESISSDVFLDYPHVAVEIALAAQVQLFRS